MAGWRREVLCNELAEAGFHRFRDVALDELLLEEVAHALAAPVHENRRPNYGAVVCTSRVDRLLMDEPRQLLPQTAPEEVRSFADGQFVFLVRSADGFCGFLLLQRYFGDEYGAYSIRDDFLQPFGLREIPPWDIGVVQRTQDGEIRVLGSKNIAIRRHEQWMTKHYKYSYAEGINASGNLCGEEVLTIREATALCVHGLSAARVGATLVIKRTEGTFEDVGPQPTTSPSLRGGLAIDDSRWHPGLQQLLAQTDGATLVRANGQIEAIGVQLQEAAVRRVSRHPGGMRHNSAKVYSAAHPDCVVIVVSADGPVTVFIAGAKVPPREPVAAPLETDSPVRCQECGVDFLVDPDSSGSSSEGCPTCGGALPKELCQAILRPYYSLS